MRLGRWKLLERTSHYVWPAPLDKQDTPAGQLLTSRNYTPPGGSESVPTLGTWPLLYELGRDPAEAYNVAENLLQAHPEIDAIFAASDLIAIGAINHLLAHEAAMHRLGGHVTGFSDAKMTRAGDFYQESIKDTVHMLEYYGDAIVMRHYQQGAPHEAARWASIPVLNAGDGWGEHPTQVLTDLYTVWREKGRLDGLRWLAVGLGVVLAARVVQIQVFEHERHSQIATIISAATGSANRGFRITIKS